MLRKGSIFRFHDPENMSAGTRIRLLSALPFLVLLALGGCSTAPRPQYMVPSLHEYRFTNTNKVLNVEMVLGGETTDEWIQGSRIDRSSYLEALLAALSSSNLFKEIHAAGSPDYSLSTLIMGQSQPSMGLNMEVILKVRYILYKGKDGPRIWEKDIFSRYTAKVSESIIGATRIKKANEGAVRENLKLLLVELNALNL